MAFDAIVLAAGTGDRFGGPTPKQFELLGGIPVVVRAVRSALAAGAGRVVVVVGEDRLGEARELLRDVDARPGSAAAGSRTPSGVTVVAGGRTRVDSCRLGLASLEVGWSDEGAGAVVVHDAARPLAAPELFERVVAAVDAGADAATAAVASSDTVGRVVDAGLVEVLDRSRLARIQTPQAFRRGVLVEAHRRAEAGGDTTPTDDCGLVLRYVAGARIAIVVGDEANLKITTRADLELAELLLRRA